MPAFELVEARDGLDTQSDHDAEHHVAVAADEGDQARKDREQGPDHRDRLEEWPQPSTGGSVVAYESPGRNR